MNKLLRGRKELFLFALNVLFVMLISGAGNKVFATHAAGSDLTYTWVSGNTYRVKVAFYRDCAGVAAPTTVTLNVKSTSCSQNFNVTLPKVAGTGQEITFPCNPTSTICNGGTNPGIQLYEYQADVTLPTQCTDWIFSYSVCCRNCAINTITNQANCNNSSTGNALYVEALLNNLNGNHNSSPQFTNIPVAFVCLNQTFTYNHGVVDSNGDSLSYSFIAPKRSSTVDVGYINPYSATNWLSSTPAVSLNATTGDFTLTPTQLNQVAVCAVLVKEYRNGVLIGSVIRDMQFWVKDCNPNVLPTATGINGTNNFTAVICPGSSLCFTINSNDGNIGQHLTMTWNGSISGATFNVANQGGASPNYPVGTFCWTPLPSDARDQPYAFTVMIKDDNCAFNGFQVYSFSIYVPDHAVTITPTNITCFGGNNGAATAAMDGGHTPHTYLWSTGATTATISGLVAGTYSVTVTDNSGCSATNSVTLTQPTAVTASISSTQPSCNAGTNATATVTAGGGVSPYTYVWSNGQTTQTATGLTGGSSYTVTVTDASGCTKTASVTISQPSVLNVVVTSSTNVSCNGQSTGAIDLTVSGGTSPYTYIWNNSATTQDLSGIGAGTYFVTVTDSHGCSAIKTQTITQPGAVNPLITSTTINGVNIACYGNASGTASVSVTGGTGPYTYAWSNGATTSSVSNLTAGTISVTVTDANGCLGNGSLTLTQPTSAISIALDSIKTYHGFGTTCNGNSDGAIWITVSGGTPGYLYFWSNGDVTDDISGLAAGSYSVTAFDANGCTATATYVISPPTPLSVTVTSPVNGGGTNIGCHGESSGSANTTVSGGASPYTYSWSTGATTSSLSNIPAGTYSVTVTDANGCTGSGSVTLTEPAPLVPLISGVTVNGGTNITCNGGTDGSASVSATGGTPPYSYLWSNGATTSSVSGLGAGTISVTVSDLNGCSGNDSFTFTQPAPISISSSLSAFNGYNVGCNGGANGSIDLTVTGGTSPYTYNWSNGATTQDLSGLGAGTFTVTVTDANGCTASSSQTLTQPTPTNPVLTSPTVTGGTNISCNGSTDGSISVAISGGVSPYTYLWSNGATTQNLSSLSAGTYTITVTDANGCTVSSNITLTQPNPVSPALVSPTFTGGTNISCFGLFDGSVNNTVSGGTAPYTYIWSNGVTDEDLNTAAAGSYSVTITDANGCTGTGSTTLTQPTQVTLSFSLSTANGYNIGCHSDTSGSIDLTVNGGTAPYTYTWTNEATTQDLTNVGAGTYGVVVNDANNCPAVDSVTLTEPDTLVSVLSSPTFNGGYNVTCLGNNGSIDLTMTGGTTPYTYLWSNGATIEDLSGIGAGTYSVTVTDLNGCVSTGSITLTQSPPQSLSTSLSSYNGNNVSCNSSSDGSIDLTVSGGAGPFTYSWSNGETTQDLSGLNAGTYTVTVTDANGCTSTSSSTLTAPSPLTAPTVSSSFNGGYNIGCNGNTDGSIDLTPTGGTSPYTYNWSNSATTQDLSGLGAGTYSVTVTDLNGCTASTSVTLTQPPPFSNTLSSPTFGGGYNVTCAGNDGSIDLTPTGGTTPYTYNWSNGATTQDQSGLGAGTYDVTVTDANGCTTTGSITLTQSPPTSISASLSSYNGNNISCNGNTDGSIDLTVTGGAAPLTYSWSNGATTQDLGGLGAGTYSVTVTDANGCTDNASTTLTEPIPLTSPTASATYNGGYNIPCNGNTNGNIDLTPAGGTTPYTYSWSNGTTTEDLSNIGAGSYSITVTDANGCTATTSLTLTQPDSVIGTPISPTFGGGYNVTCAGNDGSIDLTVAGGTGPFTYHWSTGETTEDLSNIGAGTFSVTVTDANGCSDVSAVTLIQSGDLADSLTTSIFNGEDEISCNGAGDGFINQAITGGATPYTYVWSNGATTLNITNLGPGIYTVTVTDANGCKVVKTVELTEPGVLTESGTVVTNVDCNGNGNGSIDLNIVGGTNPFSYMWSNGSTAEDLTNLSPGSYSVTVTDINGCTYSNTITITQPFTLSSSITSSSSPSCNGSSNGTIDLSVSGGTLPYSYSWSNGATTQDQTGLGGGTFSVTVTDAKGCSTTASTTLINPPLLVAASVNATDITCFGNGDGSVDLTVSGGTPSFTYSWSNGSTTQDLTNLLAGNYSVTITDANGCTATGSAIVNEPALLTAVVSSFTDSLACNAVGQGSIDITVTGGTTPYTYSWNNGSTTQDQSGLSGGTYDVTVTDANGCSTVLPTSVVIVQTGAVTLVADATDVTGCYGDLNGSIDLSVSGGQAPFTYTWSNGTTTQDLSGIGAGSYSVTVVDVNGCSSSTSATVNQPTQLLPTLSSSSQNVTCNGACDGTAILNSAIGGTAPYSYQWSNGVTTISNLNLCPGSYSVTVTDANGCTATTSSTITEPPVLDAVVTSFTDSLGCNASGSGSIDITVTGGTTPFTYSWSNGSTTQDQSGLSGGTYDVTVTDANGCSTVLPTSVVIVQTGAVTLVADATDVTGCYGDLNGSIDLTVSGGQAPFTYTWSNSATTQDLSGIGAGSYSVTVVDVNGCSSSTSATVNQPTQLLPTLSSSSQNVTCNGACDGTAILNSAIGGTAPYSYQWSNGATTISNLNLCPGTYDVTVTDANGCTATTSTTITEPPVLDAVVTSFTDSLGCNASGSGSIDITVTGGTTPFTYSWSNGSTTQDQSGLSGGTYDVTVTDANGCSTVLPTSVVIVQTGAVILVADATDVTGCYGDLNGSIDLTVSGGQAPFTYTWSNGTTTQDLSGIGAGSYSVTVVDVNGCSSTTSATVNQPTQLLPTLSSSSQNVTCNGACDGTAILNSAIGGTAPYSYQWSNGATTISNLNLCPGTYDVTVTDANGCTATTSSTITEPPVLTTSVVSYTDTLGCNAAPNSGSIDITVGGGTPSYSYSWSNGATTQDLSNLGAGTYSVTVTDANGCTAVLSSSLTITVVGNPTATATPSNVTGCFGNLNGSVDLTVNDGQAPFTFSWSNSATTEDLTNIGAGTYTVTITDVNGCTATASATVTQPAQLLISTTNASDVSCFGAFNGSIDLTISGGAPNYTYNWSDGHTDEDITGLGPGTFDVTVTDANGCTVTGSGTIVEPTQLADTGIVTNVTCAGANNGSIDLQPSGATPSYTFSWNNSAITEDLNGIGGGNYSVTITDANGCSIEDSFTVDEPTPLIASATIVDSVLCNGASDATVAASASGGTSPYTYSWSNGATTDTLTLIAAGNYSVTITDANGCTATANADVSQPPVLDVTASTYQSVSCNGLDDASASAGVNGGTAPYTYSWSNGATTDSIQNIGAGSYTLTVTDVHGCSDTTTLVVTEPLVLDANVSQITDVNCQDASSGAVDISVSGGTGPYTYSWNDGSTTQDITSVVAGTYSVTVTDANGCTDTLSAVVNPATTIVANITSTNPITCNGANDGSLTVNVVGGVAPYTYAWSNAATTQSITNLGPNVYVVTVTDNGGCMDTATFTLTEPAIPQFTAGGVTDVCGDEGTLTATVPAGYTGSWTLLSGTGNIDDPSSSTTGVSSLSNGTNEFVWTITNGTCTFSDTAVLNANILTIDAGNDQSSCDSMNLQLAGQLSSGSGQWSSPDAGITFSNSNDPDATTSGLTVGANMIIWTVSDGNCIEIDTLIITVRPPEECNQDSLEMPNGFSPNGDGPNDYFVIHGLVHYPDNEFKVFNRWGNLVYEKKNYNNEWNGTNNSGEMLPDGTYFVIFGATNLTVPLTGYVDMRR